MAPPVRRFLSNYFDLLLFIPCEATVSFLLHVKYIVLYRLVSYQLRNDLKCDDWGVNPAIPHHAYRVTAEYNTVLLEHATNVHAKTIPVELPFSLWFLSVWKVKPALEGLIFTVIS